MNPEVLKPKSTFVAKNVNQETYKPYASRYVKNEYDESLTENDATLDVDISVMLKKENKAFKEELGKV